MTTTLSAFRDTLRAILKDKTLWRDAMLNGWIKDAIRDYSNYFPMEAVHQIDCQEGVREYSLSTPGEVLGVLSVEYPEGQDPPRFLQRKSELAAGFWDGPYYDLRMPLLDTAASGDPAIYPVLVIGEAPAASEDILLRYLTVHRLPSSDSSSLTIPDEHLEAIRLFVYWKALTQISLDQEVDLGRKSAILTALGHSAKDAEYAYHYKIKSFFGPAPNTGLTGPWKMDDSDRIY